MFDQIARRYDLANHLLSGGVDYCWRRRAAEIVSSWAPSLVLDLATGSGDLALAIRRKLPDAEITAADFSPEMLAIARSKGVTQTVVADALQLPFRDGAFHCVTVAFGLRNMADWGVALREMSRVLTSSGKLLVLDFSTPGRFLHPVYHIYLRHLLPRLAGAITGHKDAYDYLNTSIEAFPSGEAMTQLIRENGFVSSTAIPLTGGIATIYTAAKSEGE
ncbi:bifunctional demethylmenaquinone methyltransferase/2-methoxy-6-polyprenyl-1,4-benzoquinol methylase UbiE [soil metagenome]